jgi:putative membrane protein
MDDRHHEDASTRARTHLANERTFLAWFRTGLTLVALGLAAGQFLTDDGQGGIPFVQTLASVVIATGGLAVAVGAYRYWQNRVRIDLDEFATAGRSVAIALVAAIATVTLAIVFVWLLR